MTRKKRDGIDHGGPSWRVGPAAPVLTTILLSACAAGIVTRIEEPIAPRDVIVVESLAVMPVTTDLGAEGMGPELSMELSAALAERFPEMRVLSPEAAGERLGRSGAAGEYARMLEDFDRTAVVDVSRVHRVLDRVGTTHLLQARSSYVKEDFLDPYLWYDDLMVEERQELVVVMRLWGREATRPVWEAVARTRSVTSEFGTERRRPQELIQDLADRLVERIPLR